MSTTIYAYSDRKDPGPRSWMLSMNAQGEGVLSFYERRADGTSVCVEQQTLPGGKMTLSSRHPIVDGVYREDISYG